MPDFFALPDDHCFCTVAKRAFLYDSEGVSPAVLSTFPLEGRPVLVENSAGLNYVFRPVDKVVYGPTDPQRCDAFLHTTDRKRLFFVELKLWNMRSGWLKAGVEQLKSVLCDFKASHPLIAASATVRRAYVCNPCHARFRFSVAEEIRDFHRETGYSLYPEGKVSIS